MKLRVTTSAAGAKAFRGEGRAVYWIDGPDAGALAKLFKKTARNLTVAAPENGDMATVDAPPDPGPASDPVMEFWITVAKSLKRP